MGKLIASVHSTANNIVTGPPTGDETDFIQWAQPGINETMDSFLTTWRTSTPCCSAPPTPIDGPALNRRITELKQAGGGDMMTFGSPVLVQSLTNARLFDEYQIIVHPVIVSEGRRLFDNLDGRTDLRMVNVETFSGGAMLITYTTLKP